MTVADSKIYEKRIVQLQQGSNRWTENIMMLESWCKNGFQLSNQDFCNSFGIPIDLDVEF
jgi:Leucine zipper with capping helix domain